MKKGLFRIQRRVSRSTGGTVVIFLLLTIAAAFMVLPLVYSIINAFKPLDELFLFPPHFFVKRPTPMNFVMLFQVAATTRIPFSRYIFNSVFISCLSTVLHVVIASMAAYPLAKYRLKVRWLFQVVVMAMLFNGTVLWLPQYVILSKLGAINTYMVYILPFVASSLGLFLMKQFIEQVPTSLIEISQIEGANQAIIFWRIIMPQVKPGWLTLTVFCFQNIWNTQPLNMVFDEELKMMNMAITQITSAGISRLGVSMAAGVLLMLPPLIVFIFTQNSIIETMAFSGIKE